MSADKYPCIFSRQMAAIVYIDSQRARVGYELAITILYPTSASGIILLLKTPKIIAIFELPSCFIDAYQLRYLWSMVYELINHSLLTNQH